MTVPSPHFQGSQSLALLTVDEVYLLLAWGKGVLLSPLPEGNENHIELFASSGQYVSAAIRRVLAWQFEQEMERQNKPNRQWRRS